jgi:hypothetical protein
VKKLLHFSTIEITATVDDLAGMKTCMESEVNVTRGIGVKSPACLTENLQQGDVAVGDASEMKASLGIGDSLRDVLNGLMQAIALIDV